MKTSGVRSASFKNIQYDGKDTLKFQLVNTHVSYANTLRRIILTEVPSVAFRAEIQKSGSTSDIKIEKNVGGSVEDSELIEGIVLDKEKIHSSMPSQIKDAKIALIDSAVEIKNTEMDAKIQITDPEKMQSFLEMEEKMLRTMVDKIVI